MFNPFKAETAPIRHLVKSGSDLVGAVIVRFVHVFLRLLILVFNQSSDTTFCRRQTGHIGGQKRSKNSKSDNQMLFCVGPKCCQF